MEELTDNKDSEQVQSCTFNQSRVRRLGKVKAFVLPILVNTRRATNRNNPDIVKSMKLDLDQN